MSAGAGAQQVCQVCGDGAGGALEVLGGPAGGRRAHPEAGGSPHPRKPPHQGVCEGLAVLDLHGRRDHLRLRVALLVRARHCVLSTTLLNQKPVLSACQDGAFAPVTSRSDMLLVSMKQRRCLNCYGQWDPSSGASMVSGRAVAVPASKLGRITVAAALAGIFSLWVQSYDIL